jgi:hypothetical protein
LRTQFTKRTVAPEAWKLPEFRAVNRFSTALWAASFAACDVIALTVAHPLRIYLPIALMVAGLPSHAASPACIWRGCWACRATR